MTAATLLKRSFAFEVRAAGRRLEGYAAVFNSEATIAPGYLESIAPGAFSRSLRERKDILALVDHDPARVLARTRSGTLRLNEDAKGLAFDLDVPDTQAGRDVLALAARGDLGGMSFSFDIVDETIDGAKHVLRAVNLFEISVVAAWPAYAETTVNARSRGTPTPFRSYTERTLRILELDQ